MVDAKCTKTLTKRFLADFTDVGFDSYGLDCSGIEYSTRMNRLAELAPQAKFWVLPKVFRVNGLPSRDKLIMIFNNCVNYAYNNIKVVGIFSWAYDASLQGSIAFREFSDPTSAWYDPEYMQRHIEVSRDIIQRSNKNHR